MANDTMLHRKEQIEILEQVLDLFAQAAEMLHLLHDPYLTRTVVAELEGREGGWTGGTSADLLRQKLESLRSGQTEEPEVERCA